MLQDTIAGISTAMGEGAISIIRLIFAVFYSLQIKFFVEKI